MTKTQKKIRAEIARRLAAGEITTAQYEHMLAIMAKVDAQRAAKAEG